MTFISRRGQSLDRDEGILKIIKDKILKRTLDAAKIVGVINGAKDTIWTRDSVQFRKLQIDLDASGQVDPGRCLAEDV